jgi:fused signal recognition particle receptor
MRRWFRKKDHEPPPPDEAVSPEAEVLSEPPQPPHEEEVESSPGPETGPLMDTPPPEDVAADSAPAEPPPQEEAAVAAPRRGFFRRMFHGPQEAEEPAPLPEMEEPAPLPEAEEPVDLLEVEEPAPLPTGEESVSLPETEAQLPSYEKPELTAPEELQAPVAAEPPLPPVEEVPPPAPEEGQPPTASEPLASIPEEPPPLMAEQVQPAPAETAPPPTVEALQEPKAILEEVDEEELIIDLDEVLEDEQRALETRKRRFRRFRERLVRTRKSLAGGLERLFLGRREVDAEVLDELEEILITADIGVDTSLHLVEVIREKVKRRELRDAARLKEALREEMLALFKGSHPPARTARPWVVLLVGVNGVGKTTTIAKLAYQDRVRRLTPLLIAADTFRAAAVEQLEIWGDRVGAQVVKQKTGADPAAVVFDGLTAALSRDVDMVYVDTAGRLHTKVNLMEELKKIHRTAGKKLPGSPHETLLVLDATTGQNALNQARMFHEAVGVTGIILTKLDGTAKGGMALAVAHETGLPLRYLGVGERMDDLQPFDAEAYVAAILD